MNVQAAIFRWVRGRKVVHLVVGLGLVGGMLAVQAQESPVQALGTNTLHLSVVSAVDGTTPVGSFKYLINLDNTGTTGQRENAVDDGQPCSPIGNSAYPASCSWTSMGVASSSPVVTSGTDGDFAGNAGVELLDGPYVVSVLADGYKLDGAHFTLPVTGDVVVLMQPIGDGLPTATIQSAVFEDISPVNSAPDLPLEHGLAGFKGQINDYLGQVTTDVLGNPLCSGYDGTGTVITGTGGNCLSKCYVVDNGLDLGTVAPIADGFGDGIVSGVCPTDPTGLTMVGGGAVPPTAVIEGKVKIPNLGPNRYTLSISPVDGSGFIQTTTLEGNHDWDAWVMEGATGLDTEFVQGGEPFPAIIFGYVRPTNLIAGSGGLGHVKGVVTGVKVYYPPKGGTTQQGQIFGGLAGAKIDKPISDAWVTLTRLDGVNLDTAVYVGKADVNGAFDIANVPDGSYTISWWDEAQNDILDLQQLTVNNGEVVDLGILPLNGWWTYYDGYVFNDTNRNGVKDAGEAGIPNFTLTMRKRENSLMGRGSTTARTDANGYYKFEGAYPMTQWYVMEAYNDRYYSTGATFQADNQPTPTTIHADRDANGKFTGSGVDVSTLPIIGLGGHLDWGVHPYDATGTASNGVDPRNGGIVGTVSYDTTRNELDPRYAAVEDWQPGVSGLTVDLFTPILCGTNAGVPCDVTGRYEVATDGSYATGTKINTYVTETWQQPTGCTARDVDGNPLVAGVDEKVLPTTANAPCLEGPLEGVQFENGWAAVDGNYGFGEGCFGPTGTPLDVTATDPSNPTCDTGAFSPLPGGKDYLVRVEIPDDAQGRPAYKFTREEDINIANGDQFVPQVPPPACAGALHTVDVKGILPDGANATDNATFAGIGGSPYEGMAKPLCDTKLVTLANGKSIVPTFNVFTDVPLPGRFWGLVVDDLNFSTNPRSLMVGEKSGVPFAPIGIYDYTGRLVHTAESDFNGLWDVLMPSTNRINCPTPSGVCGNLYRFVGNDPGTPGHLNANFHPEFRTIAAEFEALPGLIVPADLAPTQVGVTVQLPGGQINQVACKVDIAAPQILAVSKPYGSAVPTDGITIKGSGFGAAAGSLGKATIGGAPLAVTSWSDESIVATIPAGTTAGIYQLDLVNAGGRKTVNGLTFHVIGSGYSPTIVEVGPGKTFAPASVATGAASHAIQNAIDAAPAGALVVVYPGRTEGARVNPRGAYFENLVIDKPIKLQGTGSGGVTASGATIPGSIIDGSAFSGDSPVAQDWQARVATLTWDGNQTVNDGADITILAHANGANAFPPTGAATALPRIDGFDLRGGDQQGFPTNINAIGGAPTGLAPQVVTQGGAVFANAYARSLQITNNVVQNNGGGYGTIRIGTPELPDGGNHNENVRIANNRIIQNAGTNLAGGIGLFYGSDNYEISGNDICGNFSSEYGGGISHYGLSPNGKIHDNRIYFNESYDEGAGIMIAGQLPANPAVLTAGSGPVDIYDNVVQANVSNDDGGGIRFLMAGDFPMNVFNNVVVNNVSAHEGGGISINDAPAVRVFNNTIMKNLTTATAVTSNGSPAPAGLSTSDNSAQLQATLPALSPTFSDPLLFNNIFWDNRAGTRAGAAVNGLDATGANHWDLGNAAGSSLLSPTNSVLQVATGTVASPTNQVNVDPQVVGTTDMGVTFQVWRNNPAFMGAMLVAADVPPGPGDYHLAGTSPAIDAAIAAKSGVNAPAFDIDTFARPFGGGFDIGADEFGNVAQIADLAITKTDGQTVVAREQVLTYTVTVTNNGPAGVAGAPVTDPVPAQLQNMSWTCAGSGVGNSRTAASGPGGVSVGVTLASGGSATITVRARVRDNVNNGMLISNTVTVTAPAGTLDPNPSNNTATDTDVVGVDVAVAKTDNTPSLYTGTRARYTIVVSKNSVGALAGIGVVDPAPVGLTQVTWTCQTTTGGSCGNGGNNGSGSINRTVSLGGAGNATVTYIVTGRVTATSGTVTNTVTVTPPVSANDPNTANNVATDVDTIAATPAAPAPAVIDNFNRANLNNLGGNWRQLTLFNTAAIRVNGNQATTALFPGDAIWGAPFGASQAAGFTFANTTVNNTGLYLRVNAMGGINNAQPVNFLLLTYNNGNLTLSTNNANNAGQLPVTFANGDTLTARTDAGGTIVFVYKNGTYVGLLQAPANWGPTGLGGRVGIRLPTGGRIDDFQGATLP